MNILLKLFLIFFTIFSLPAFALDVVYPKKNTPTINAKSTFFIGNIGDDKEFYINNNKVQTYKDGIFVVVVPLNFGVNNFTLKSVSKNSKETILTYKITRPKPIQSKTSPQQPQFEKFNNFILVETTKNNIPLRETSSNSSFQIFKRS